MKYEKKMIPLFPKCETEVSFCPDAERFFDFYNKKCYNIYRKIKKEVFFLANTFPN